MVPRRRRPGTSSSPRVAPRIPSPDERERCRLLRVAMRGVRLTLEYDGTDFAGWQRQPPPARSVQAVIEDALAEMTGARVILRGAGRTDAGVHARAQVAAFATESAIPAPAFMRGL